MNRQVAQTATMWDPQPKIHTTVLRLEPTTPLPYEWLQKGEVVEDKEQEKTEVTAVREGDEEHKPENIHMFTYRLKQENFVKCDLIQQQEPLVIFLFPNTEIWSLFPNLHQELKAPVEKISSAIWVPGCPSKPVRFSVMR